MIKEIKSTSTSKSCNFLKDFTPAFADLLEKIIVFNPSRRIKIDDILNHEVVKAFHKPEEETTCDKMISTSIDDNKKFTVDEYRKLVYGVSVTKPKALSASLGSGATSAKYLPSAQNKTAIMSSTNTPKASGEKPEMTKKFSHEKLRTNTMQTTYTKISEPVDPKKFEKPVLKYVKSSKEMTRPENSILTQYKAKIEEEAKEE